MLNLASNLTRSAFVFPDRIAVAGEDGRLTYRQLDRRCSQLAHSLRRLGVRPGDTVALACGNRAAFVAAYYAILRAGAIVVPLNAMLQAREFAHHYADAGARAVICQEGGADCPTGARALQAWKEAGGSLDRFIVIPETGDEAGAPFAGLATLGALARGCPEDFDNHPSGETDTAVILYTSGTTGVPKGAELSHSNLALNAAYSCLMQKADSCDVHLVALPLFHAFGQTLQMNAAVTVGAALVLMPRFNARAAWSAMAEHGVTLFAGVPTMYQALLETQGEASEAGQGGSPAPAWRLGMSGGAALPVAVIEAFEARLGLTLLEGYGLSETSPLATFSFPDTPKRAGSVGYPLYGTEARLCGPGEDGRGQVQLRGHHVMKGYRGRPDATREVLEAGWLSTGDLGSFDADGALRIVDRAKDVIIRGGYNVYPREIEELLMTHPAVGQAAVVGVPDPRLGEEVAAVVVPREAGAITEAELVQWLRERLAAYKYPRQVRFAAALPRNATGKVLKQALRERLGAPARG